MDLARSKQEALAPAAKKVVSELGIPAVKYALDLNGYYGGLPRLPLLPLTAAQKAEVEAQMSRFPN
jgi:dihydrodipicolinate synthase/N-acetylneuraminate lyase